MTKQQGEPLRTGQTYIVTIDDSERRAAIAKAIGEACDEVAWSIFRVLFTVIASLVAAHWAIQLAEALK
jgi:hypothetical protein